MNPWLALLIGVVCAAVGGELFVRGAVSLATWARVSAGIIGATVAAFATSSPELSVAIGSSVAGQPEISFGDAVGSNVVNVGLILGLALCISGIQAPRPSALRDLRGGARLTLRNLRPRECIAVGPRRMDPC